MSQFEFVSHQQFTDDKYIKEIVYILVNGLRIAFVHKIMQTGGSFWDVMANSVTVGEKKESHKAVKFGDAFLIDDIKDYLKRRKWEAGLGATYSPTMIVKSNARSISEAALDEQLPF
jgi:hypothetical protein